MNNWITFLVLFTTGFTACVEFGCYAFVRPILSKLNLKNQIIVEKGLEKDTFGRIMPFLMTGAFIILTTVVIVNNYPLLLLVASILWGTSLVTTVVVNVPINRRTLNWQDEFSKDEWYAMRRKWELFQALRSWLLLLSFGLVCASLVLV